MGVRRAGAVVASKYRLTRRLGSGATGEVYECEHLVIGKRLAVKLLRIDVEDAPEIVARFRREARAASAIDSEYIVQVVDFGADREHGFYMVMELLVGEDLEAYLARERRVEPDEATRIAYQIARGLARAHGAGVVHRDLKPANVFLASRGDEEPVCKILDFGISTLAQPQTLPGDHARAFGGAGDAGRPGVVLGTPQYMSPEQIEACDSLDGRTDVWSLSVLLYEMLAGEPPFGDRPSIVALFADILRRPAPPLLARAPWVPEPLAEVVHAGLERDRDRRIRDALTFSHELARAMPCAVRVSGRRISIPDAYERDASRTIPAPPPADPIEDDGIPISVGPME
jgi:serine/threonine protein kinase